MKAISILTSAIMIRRKVPGPTSVTYSSVEAGWTSVKSKLLQSIVNQAAPAARPSFKSTLWRHGVALDTSPTAPAYPTYASRGKVLSWKLSTPMFLT